MSQVERFSQVIPANGRLELPRGNLLILISATAAVNVRLDARGTSEGINGITGGLRLRRVRSWDNAIIVGAAGTACVYFIGQDEVTEDETDIFLQVSVIAGTVAVADSPSVAISTPAGVNVATGAASTIAANALRRRITICALSTNTGSIFIQAVGAGAGRGIELQPGLFVEMQTTVALDVRNDSGAAQDFTTFEES